MPTIEDDAEGAYDGLIDVMALNEALIRVALGALTAVTQLSETAKREGRRTAPTPAQRAWLKRFGDQGDQDIARQTRAAGELLLRWYDKRSEIN